MTDAIVTGASHGLGRATALALAAGAGKVHLLARNADALSRVASEIRSQGGRAESHVVDITADDYLHTLRNLAARLDVAQLLINGGGPRAGDLDDLLRSDWEHAHRLLVTSAVDTLTAFTPTMVERGYGRIVVVGSSSVRQPIPGLLLSNVYRLGVLGLIKSVAPDLMRSGVTVNMVSPGRMDTDRVRALDGARAERNGTTIDEERAISLARIPAGRYGQSDEFAAVASFLLSPSAGYVTGQNILVDGGMTTALP